MGRSYKPDAKIQLLVETIDSTEDEKIRIEAISQLANIPGSDSSRALIDAYRTCLWRETKIAIIRALGNSKNARTFEFLTDIANNTDDLPLSAESLLALGATGLTMAGSYLARISGQSGHPLQKEAIIGLSKQPIFDCENELLQILAEAVDLSPTVVQYAILACARRRIRKSWPTIRGMLESTIFESSGPVFNAALVAAGMVAEREDIAFLRGLNTRYRFFADQLLHIAIQQIEERSSQRVVDLTTLFLAADSDDSRIDYALALQFQHFDLMRDEIAKAGVDLSFEIEVLLLSLRMREEVARQRFINLLSETSAQFGENVATAIWNFQRVATESELLTLKEVMTTEKQCAVLWELVPTPFSLGELSDSLASVTRDETTAVTAINALAIQAHLIDKPNEINGIAKVFFKICSDSASPRIRQRAIRAVGQLRTQTNVIANDLVALLKSDPECYASVYYALAMLGNSDCGKVLSKRLRQLIANPVGTGEFGACLRAVAECQSNVDVDSLERLKPEQRREHERVLLRILTRYRIPEYDDMVHSALDSRDHQRRLAGIAAAAVSGSEELLKKVYGLIKHSNTAVAGRALHAICVGSPSSMQCQLLGELFLKNSQVALIERAVRMIIVHEDGHYLPMVGLLDEWIDRKDDEPRREAVNAAINLRDNIQLKLAAAPEVMEADKEPARPMEQHAIDGSLKSALQRFDEISDTIRSVLRNAELTFSNPELFNERVDKSTVIVEFVKSIDLFLQEKLGGSLFLNPSREVFTRLQSRVMHLQLDDETISSAKRLRDLQCSSHFDVDTFPSHKLVGLARLVVSGKILKDQYRAVDGLRAWALVLLVFGREFTYQGQILGALLPVRDSRNRNICDIAATLNRLQEVRNLAAHRGTMLEQKSLTQVRGDSLRVLSRLIDSF